MEKQYEKLKKELRVSKCSLYLTEEMAYSCVTYYLSPNCYNKNLSNRGLEIGEERI